MITNKTWDDEYDIHKDIKIIFSRNEDILQHIKGHCFGVFESLLHIGHCVIEDKLINKKIMIPWYEMRLESLNIMMDNDGTRRDMLYTS